MSATALLFNNRLTRIPGAQTKVNASGLDAPAPGSIGRVALLGTSDGFTPASAYDSAAEVLSFTTVEAYRSAFRGGDLLEAGAIAFAPSRDERVGGAVEVLPLKVDNATVGTVTLTNSNGNAIVLTSRDYGPHVNQIHVTIASGTVQGSLITVVFEDITETKDNVGGNAFFTIQYTEPPAGTGWDTMTGEILTSGIRANALRSELGRDGELLNPSGTGTIEIVSSNAADTTQVVSIYGVSGGTPVVRTATLNGTSAVLVSGTFDATAIYGVSMSAAALGTVTVRHVTGPVNLFQMTAGQVQRGGAIGQAMFLAGDAVTQVADGASTAGVFYAGRNTSGATVLEVRALNGTTPVDTLTTTWAQIDFIGLALVAAARTITFTATAVQTLNTTQDTLQKAADHFNARRATVSGTAYGFVFTLGTTRTTFEVADLDISAATVNIDNPATGSFYANLAQQVEFFNDESALLSAAASVGAIGGGASNTAAPVYLSGGAAASPVLADWQTAIDLLRFLDVDTIVPLTGDPAVHAAVIEHLNYMAGPGKMERDAVFGILNAGLTANPSRTEILARIPTYNNRNVRAVAQSMTRLNTEGDETTFLPQFLAALVAGMQAGGPVGQPLTHKLINALGATQAASWDPITNAEEMIAAGLLIVEDVPILGRRIVRNVTTAASSDNIGFTEASVNQAINYATRSIRDDLEAAVGEPGFSGTRNAIMSRAKNRANFLVSQGVLVAWKNLQCTIVLDQAQVAIDIAPTLPVNFVPITLNLFTQPIGAAA